MELFDRSGLMQATGLSAAKINWALRLIKGPKMERIYAELEHKEGILLIESLLQHLQITLAYDLDALHQAIPKDGPFITVSNHPFGFLDGVIVLMMVGKIRPNFRAIANFLLSYFAPISDLFLTVNPFETSGPKGMGGTEKSLQQLRQGLGLALFPAGEVSTWYKGQQGISDRPWSLRSMQLIQQAQVPVIPIYFAGENSLSFHLLGKLHPALRTVRIPAEMFKKQGKTLQIAIGERIEWQQLAQYDSAEKLRDVLYNTTYGLRETLISQ